MEIAYSSKLSDNTSPINSCLSPSSSLVSRFSHSIAFSPTSSLEDFNSRLSHPVFSSTNSNTNKSSTTTTTTVPLMASSPTTNIIFTLTQPSNSFNYFHHPPQRHGQQPIVETSDTTSSKTAPTTHVLCR